MTQMLNGYQINAIKPLHDNIIVKDMHFDARLTSSGIIIVNDDGKNSGIRPRWAQVYAVGPDQKEITVGQWICVAHGRWSRGIKIVDSTGEHVIRRVDNNDILLISDSPVEDFTMGDKVV
jgi:co-chaperonin GroES (HSP10)